MKTLAEHIRSFDELETRIARVEIQHGNTIRLVVNQRTGGSMVIVGMWTVVCDDPGYRCDDVLMTVDEIDSVDQL